MKFYKKKQESGLKFPSQELLAGFKPSFKSGLSEKLIFFRIAAIILIILALARIRSPVLDSKIQAEGIDIVLAIDCSTSMLAEDFKLAGRRQNRLTVVKNVVKDFINARQNDHIGLVAFAARAYMVSPLTLDYAWLFKNLERIDTNLIEDGTAIGLGITSAVKRFKQSQAKSKVIILLTDGRNNAGEIQPLVAAEAARAMKIKIYTIGAGAKGPVPYPVRDFFGNTAYQRVQIDIEEDVLTKIASLTGAKYFRATGTESLREIYQEIDRLEKTKIEQAGYREYDELFPHFLIFALVVLFLEIILGNTVLRKIP